MITRIIKYRKWISVVMVVLVLAGVLFYYGVLLPLKAEVLAKSEQLKTVSDDLQRVMTKLGEKKEESPERSWLLKRVHGIPTAPEVHQFIIDMEQVEKIAGVSITNISFSLPDMEGKQDYLSMKERSEKETVTEQQESSSKENQSSKAGKKDLEKKVFPESLYPFLGDRDKELEKLDLSEVEIHIQLEGSRESTLQFLQEVQKLKRIIHVENIQYQAERESSTSLESRDPLVKSTVSLKGYYIESFREFLQ